MKKTILITVLLAMSLAACSAGAASTDQVFPVIQETDTNVESVPDTALTEEAAVQIEPTAIEGNAREPETLVTEEPPQLQSFTLIPGESKVTYEVGEVFIREGNVFNMAVGVTDALSGDIQIDYSNPQNSMVGPISVDISKFTSDQNLRDKAIRERFLESEKYPIATFVATHIEGMPEVGEEGVEYPLKISGDLTVREITKEVTFDAVVKVENDVLSGKASTTLLMSEFGFGPIDIIGILKTEDEVKLTFDLVANASSTQQ